MFRKKIVVPESNGEELEAVQLWSVEWQGRIGESSFDKTREAEFFTNEEDAKTFAHSLREAFKLIRHKPCDIIVKKRV